MLGITTVFGNRQLERTNRNTLAFLELIGKENIPVAKGSDKPLIKPLKKYEDEGPYVVHGAEGLGYAQVPEFTKKNIDLNAEAAKIVFESGIPIIMCPLDATEKGYITRKERENITKVNSNKLGHFMFEAIDCYGNFYETVAKKDGCVLHDSMAVVAISKPEILNFKPALIGIITDGEEYGRTVELTNLQENTKYNCMVATDVNREAFIDLFFSSLSN